ncbi:uncharacterized protein KY384_001418 [Bacidia gigantensis]|uniref:uncharacterized protein n=1 Tax=Bacidia gigantensis TaxID=2732470 RepID=UPI001D04C35E|nr:uncharacterized protein KY384_001418 [Bacidia gigantensis]KAG8533677.1 hypothetical protein KY384_001418 [Bacidia gigantensis]
MLRTISSKLSSQPFEIQLAASPPQQPGWPRAMQALQEAEVPLKGKLYIYDLDCVDLRPSITQHGEFPTVLALLPFIGELIWLCSDAFTKREQASEDYEIKRRELEKLQALKEKIAGHQKHLEELDKSVYVASSPLSDFRESLLVTDKNMVALTKM